MAIIMTEDGNVRPLPLTDFAGLVERGISALRRWRGSVRDWRRRWTGHGLSWKRLKLVWRHCPTSIPMA